MRRQVSRQKPVWADRVSARRAWAAAAATLCCLSVAAMPGCSPSRAKQIAIKNKNAAEKQEKAKEPDVPGEVHGLGWRIRWRERDPKDPQNRTIPTLDADSERGRMINKGKEEVAILEDVHARLYREGKLAARITAPTITTRRGEKAVVGTGGVTLTSITDPPDTVVTADSISWNTDTSKIVATGNAFLTRHRKDSPPDTTNGNRIVFDTRLKDFLVE